MVTEQDKTLEALQIAVQMEIDGKEYYQKASQSSDNQLGRELFQSLAVEEDIHRRKFKEIYDAIKSRKAWPETDFKPEGGLMLKSIFAKATAEMGSDVKAPASEMDAIRTAMTMENKTYDFYKSQSRSASHAAEKVFYEALSIQERKHHQVLLDYYEYLKDPAGWFVTQEHPSLDGG